MSTSLVIFVNRPRKWNRLSWTMRIAGSFQISSFLMAGRNSLHCGQYQDSLSSKRSSSTKRSKQSSIEIGNSSCLMFSCTLSCSSHSYIKESVPIRSPLGNETYIRWLVIAREHLDIKIKGNGISCTERTNGIVGQCTARTELIPIASTA